MKTAALLACATVLCVLVAADRASAQSVTVPEQPAISGVTAAAHALTVTWTAPTNTGGAEDAYVSYILGAPEFVNRVFVELFPEGLPAITPLVARSKGTPSAGTDGDGAATN